MGVTAKTRILISQAEKYGPGTFEQQEKLAEARDILSKVHDLLGVELYEYLKGRGDTASIGANARDLWWIPLLILAF